jgi:glycine oxidase
VNDHEIANMSKKVIDYIIVGQGMAGSCIALQLLYRDKSLLVIDKPHPNTATRIAAGLFNPITGRQMGKTWMADELFPRLHDFYQKAERFTGSKFFFPMPLYRPFLSVEEQNEWMGRSADARFTYYIEKLATIPMFPTQVKNSFGGLVLKQCGYVNTHHFLNAVRKHLENKNSFLEEDFDESLVSISDNRVMYKHWQARRIIFCTGEKARQSRFFSWLPIRPLKGETLTLKTDVDISTIYNRGVYLVPDLMKVGATYAVNDHSPHVTEEARVELTNKLNELISFPYSIVDQQWGFRPTTPDRRPILGNHPENEQLVVFNGLGTKGVSLAPYFSEVLVKWMEKEGPLDLFVDVNRYKSVYSKSA